MTRSRRKGRSESSIRCRFYVDNELELLESELHEAIAHGAWDTARPLQKQIEQLQQVKSRSTRNAEMALRRGKRQAWLIEAKQYHTKMDAEEARDELRMAITFDDASAMKRAVAAGATTLWHDLLGDGSNNSAVYLAVVKGHLHLAKWLVECAGADVNAATKRFGYTPVFVAAFWGRPASAKICQMLWSLGADVDQSPIAGEWNQFTPLDIALRNPLKREGCEQAATMLKSLGGMQNKTL